MTPRPHRAVRDADAWRLPLDGLDVTQCRFDHAFTLLVSSGLDRSYEIRIEEAFVLTAAGGTLTLDPSGAPTAMAPALRLSRQTVEQAIAHDDGRLELTFTDGAAIRVPGGTGYEAWTVAGTGGLRFISLPGGELAIWDAA